jgi:hypothetical protein
MFPRNPGADRIPFNYFLIGDHNPYSLATVSSLSSSRSSIINLSNSQMHDISNAAAHIPTTQEIRSEANRLHKIFNGSYSTKVPLLEGAEDAAFVQQVLELCAKLDGSVVSGDTLTEILSSSQITHGHMDHHMDVDIKGELERAWSLDQSEILEARGQVLDKVSISLALSTSISHIIFRQ